MATIGLLLLAVGCTPNPGGPSNSVGPSPSTAAAAQDTCPNIDLRLASGERVDLNGTWVTEKEGIRQGIYYFHQVQSCVWFAGAFQWPSAAPEHGPLGWMTATFRGTLSSDFTIRGEWVDARNEVEPLPGTGGSITLKIDRGSTDVLRLLYVEGTGQPFLEPGFREEQSWIKISDDDAYPPAESPS